MALGDHLSHGELKRRMAAMGPVHEALNTAALTIVEPEAFDAFAADLNNVARVYREPWLPPVDLLISPSSEPESPPAEESRARPV